MKRAAAGAAAAALFLLLLGAGCSGDGLQGKGFRLPLSGEPRQLDPQVTDDAAGTAVLMSLFEGLTRLDGEGNPIPGAAEWTVSEDGVVYEFTLVESAWSDGTPVRAADFVFGLRRAADPATKSALTSRLNGIRGARDIAEGKRDAAALGVRAEGDDRLIITLEEPDADFIKKTASPPFFPCNQAFFEETAGQYGIDSSYILSNGPFKMRRWVHRDYLIMDKHDGYHGAADIWPAAVRYVIQQPDDVMASLEDENGLDAAWIAPEQVVRAREQGLTLAVCEDRVQFLWFNNAHAALGNRQVRVALREALVWKEVSAQMHENYSRPAEGFAAPDAVVEGGGKYRSPTNRRQPGSDDVNPRTLLNAGMAEAGVEQMGKLTLLCEDTEYALQIARYIVQSWQANLDQHMVGIEQLPADTLAARVKSGDYTLALYTATAPGKTVLDALAAFAGEAADNPARFADEAYTAAVARTSGSDAAQLVKLEKQLWDACPAVPIAFERRYAALAKGVSGIDVRPFDGGVYGAPFEFRQAGKAD